MKIAKLVLRKNPCSYTVAEIETILLLSIKLSKINLNVEFSVINN